MEIALTDTPQDLVAELSLDVATSYSVVCECAYGAAEVARFDDGSTSPETTGVRGAPFPHLQLRTIQGANLWLWVPGSSGVATVYESVS